MKYIAFIIMIFTLPLAHASQGVSVDPNAQEEAARQRAQARRELNQGLAENLRPPKSKPQLKHLCQLQAMELDPHWTFQGMATFLDVQYLFLGNLNLATLPSSLTQLKKLVTLDLSDNRLTETPSWLTMLKVLDELSLNHNELDTSKDFLKGAKHVRKLHLNGNGFTQVPTALDGMTKLVVIDLKDNKIEEIPAFISNLPLRGLCLANNMIEELPAHMSQMRNLRTLELQSNSLRSLPNFLLSLANLVYVDVSNNKYLVQNKTAEALRLQGKLDMTQQVATQLASKATNNMVATVQNKPQTQAPRATTELKAAEKIKQQAVASTPQKRPRPSKKDSPATDLDLTLVEGKIDSVAKILSDVQPDQRLLIALTAANLPKRNSDSTIYNTLIALGIDNVTAEKMMKQLPKDKQNK